MKVISKDLSSRHINGECCTLYYKEKRKWVTEIIMHNKLTEYQYRCTLIHELVHYIIDSSFCKLYATCVEGVTFLTKVAVRVACSLHLIHEIVSCIIGCKISCIKKYYNEYKDIFKTGNNLLE